MNLTLAIVLILSATGLAAALLWHIWRPASTADGRLGTLLSRLLPDRLGSPRLRSASVVVVIGILAGSGMVSALFTSVDPLVNNQFGTGCFDAQVSSTQSGQVTNNAEGTQSVAITAVNPATSVLFVSVRSNSTEPADSMIMATLASATEVQLLRRSDAGVVPDIVVRWTVVEYSCGVSVQRGTTAGNGSGTLDVVITSAPVGRSFVVTSSVPDRADASHDGDDDHLATLQTDTTLRLAAASGGSLPADHDYAWQVVTFDDPTDISVQTATQTLSATTSETVTLGVAVDPATTMVLAHAASTGTGNDIGERLARVHLASATTVEVARQLSGEPLEVTLQIIEFADGTVVQHGILNMAAATSVATASLNPVDTSRATGISTVMNPGSASGGSSDMNSGATVGEASATFEITDPSTLTVTRAASSAAASFGWQVVEWGGPNWWDSAYSYRQRIDVTTSSTETPTGYNVAVTVDHLGLVNDALARSDGQDLRVLRWNGSSWTELHRVLDDDSGWSVSDTTVWFRTTDLISASSTDSYWLYYGNSSPAPALEDPEQVWLLTEDFESGTLGDFADQTAGSGWYQADSWTSRIPLAIQASQVDANLADFPVLVQLTNASLGSGANADGTDIRFTAADGTTPLNHEVEAWNPGTGALTAWVEVPTVSSSGNTTIYLYYGAADSPAKADAGNVWQTANAIWHLADDPAGTAPRIDDSSPQRRDGLSAGSMTIGDVVAGRAGSAVDFDGTDDRLEVEPFDIGGRTLTVSAWINLDTVTGDQAIVAKADDASSRVFSLSTTGTQARFQIRVNGADYAVAGGALTTGTWYHVAATWNGAAIELFVDGVSVATGAAIGELHRDGAMAVSVGSLPGDLQPLDGAIDEVRVEPVVRSVDWLTAVTRNLAIPSVFVVAASTEAGAWHGQGTWSYRKPIAVDSSYVGTTLTDHPLLVQFVDSAMIGKLQTDGDDIVFTAADGTTRLDHQLEQFDAATGTVAAWVRIPSLSATVDTELFVYYGNGSAQNQQDPEAVFGPADLVFHGP